MKLTIFWFRRDLRLDDNKGLYYALCKSTPVLPLFIFDENITGQLPADDHRIGFIYNSVLDLDNALRATGSGLLVKKGKPMDVFQVLTREYEIEAVVANADHEPYGIGRDSDIEKFLRAKNIIFERHWDHLIMPPDKLLNNSSLPYTVFTPYSKKWKSSVQPQHLKSYSSENHPHKYYRGELPQLGPLEKWGFLPASFTVPKPVFHREKLMNYAANRDFPAIDGTTRLGLHLRFGNISIRRIAMMAKEVNETFLNELIWREFYASVLYHYPSAVSQAFKKQYDNIQWLNHEEHFDLWKNGQTGFPLVDAGMRELKATGWMHNRVRMVVAGFLTKHLLIDWRWGEAWFAGLLFDFELSSNNGGWQWCAGSGTDAAPYFRIFNPEAQQAKFDPNFSYIKKWIPEFGSSSYPKPMVDLAAARERCLEAYKSALNT